MNFFIEHLNEILKGHWSSLKEIRNQMRVPTDYVDVNKHIVVCMILHNFLIVRDDIWDNVELIDNDNDDIVMQNDET
jgi:hypothetical protein